MTLRRPYPKFVYFNFISNTFSLFKLSSVHIYRLYFSDSRYFLRVILPTYASDKRSRQTQSSESGFSQKKSVNKGANKPSPLHWFAKVNENANKTMSKNSSILKDKERNIFFSVFIKMILYWLI